jgi:hypothetical protein
VGDIERKPHSTERIESLKYALLSREEPDGSLCAERRITTDPVKLVRVCETGDQFIGIALFDLLDIYTERRNVLLPRSNGYAVSPTVCYRTNDTDWPERLSVFPTQHRGHYRETHLLKRLASCGSP